MSDEKYADIISTRGCFDISSHEYNQLDMTKKVDLLKKLINTKGYKTAGLAVGMMDICNADCNKGIKQIDLVLGLSALVDYLLTEDIICK